MRHEESAVAKINLSLRVLGKREDGFHELETLMVGLAGVEDRLSFDLEPGSGGVELRCDVRGVPRDESNLVLRALRGFEAATGLEFHGSIDLHKAVPSGAGLGGGSSDAAATLRGLNLISGSSLGDDALCAMAAEIGSDVPFFIRAEPAWCRGRGEVMEAYEGELPMREVVLIKPGFEVASAWAYSRWAESVELPGVCYAEQAAPWGRAVNDLERPVFEKYLLLPEIKGWLAAREETEVAMMSGSGATVFATLEPGRDAGGLKAAAREEFGEDAWIAAATIASPSR
jgi:4-diphosphocytidyl-2-C-methyl-D-erythritol kinase